MLVELSHEIDTGWSPTRGCRRPDHRLPQSRGVPRETYAEGTEFHIGRITMVANTGTYLDTPFHRYADGADLAGVPLDAAGRPPRAARRATPAGTAIGPDRLGAVRGGRQGGPDPHRMGPALGHAGTARGTRS